MEIKLTWEDVIDDNNYQRDYDIVVNGVTVGVIETSIDDYCPMLYVNSINVFDPFKNKGYGSSALLILAEMAGEIFLAPDNPDAQRLYARLGSEMSQYYKGCDCSGCDQGYGLYRI